MTAVGQVAYYPAKSGRRMPLSPLAHIETQFLQLFSSAKRVAKYRQAYAESVVATREAMEHPSAFNREKSFLEMKEAFIRELEEIVSAGDFSSDSWESLACADLSMVSDGPYWEIADQMMGQGVEGKILWQLAYYVGHDVSHISPRAILAEASNKISMSSWPLAPASTMPECVENHFRRFAGTLRPYFEYFERQMEIGETFFTPRSELSACRQITGDQLKPFCKMIADALALRFLGGYFKVTDEPVVGPLEQNTLEISIGSDLLDVQLPLFVVAPKIVGGLKNPLRIVETREAGLFAHDKTNPFRGLSLARKERGLPIENPVHIKIAARRLTAQTWELQFSDNGRGIIVEELLQPLADACAHMPGAVSPAIEHAVRRWNVNKDPFAFNAMPLGALLEAVYHLGVSTGTGGKGSGLGLWGSLLMLFKLGAQLKIGINPGGGFYESVVLPVNLSVAHREVKRTAAALWKNYPASTSSAA